MAAVILPHSGGPESFTWRLQAGPETWALAERPTVGEVEAALAGLHLQPGATVEVQGQALMVRDPGDDPGNWPAWFVTVRAREVYAAAVQVGATLALAGLVEYPPAALSGPETACGAPGRG